MPHSEIPGSQPCYRLLWAYRRFTRPSSPLNAKTSTVRPCCLITPTGCRDFRPVTDRSDSLLQSLDYRECRSRRLQPPGFLRQAWVLDTGTNHSSIFYRRVCASHSNTRFLLTFTRTSCSPPLADKHPSRCRRLRACIHLHLSGCQRRLSRRPFALATVLSRSALRPIGLGGKSSEQPGRVKPPGRMFCTNLAVTGSCARATQPPPPPPPPPPLPPGPSGWISSSRSGRLFCFGSIFGWAANSPASAEERTRR